LGEEKNRPLPRLVESLVERMRGIVPGFTIRLVVEEGFPSGPAVGPTVGRDTAMLRVIGEALTNTRRHSGARNVRVSLRAERDHMVAEVSDDGRGFGPETEPGVGLGSMRERALRLGGDLAVESEPGEGTRVRLRVPRGEVSPDAPQEAR
jgi:signal transduction histidine kinase